MEDGVVSTAPVSEYGKIKINCKKSKLFKDIPKESVVWMSHTDYISKTPKDYKIVASSSNCSCAAMENEEKKIYAVQFHPEVTHSEYGNNILHNFLYEICNCEGNWIMDNFIDNTVKELK